MNVAISLLLLVSLQTNSSAQTVAPMAHGRAVGEDTEHDVAANDPSDPKTALTLKNPKTQQTFAIQGTAERLAKDAGKSLLNMMSPKAILSWIDNKMHPRLTYDQMIKQKPEMFDYFKINEHRYVPQKKFGPTTVNANHEYKGISDRKFGFCWGYATFVRFFTQVAFYDPTLPRPDLKTIYAKIDRVIAGHATLFEGFSGLRELTSLPEVEFYLKLAAMELWRARAVKFDSLMITVHSTNWMDYDEVETLMKDLEARLARGEFPKIVMASLIPADPYMGMNTDIHVIPVYAVERLSKSSARIHLWDINFYTETLMKFPKYLDVDTNHGIHYAPYYEPTKPYAAGSDFLGRIVIAPENDAENVTMLYSLQHFCSNKKTAKYCYNQDYLSRDL